MRVCLITRFVADVHADALTKMSLGRWRPSEEALDAAMRKCKFPKGPPPPSLHKSKNAAKGKAAPAKG
jgi:hypothetical protein